MVGDKAWSVDACENQRLFAASESNLKKRVRAIGIVGVDHGIGVVPGVAVHKLAHGRYHYLAGFDERYGGFGAMR